MSHSSHTSANAREALSRRSSRFITVIAGFFVCLLMVHAASAQPYCLELLGPEPGVAGEVNEFQLIGFNGAEDADVLVIYGLAPGDTFVPGCHMTVPIDRPRIAGRVQLRGGAGVFSVYVPRRASGVIVLFQALYYRGCCVSNLNRTLFE